MGQRWLSNDEKNNEEFGVYKVNLKDGYRGDYDSHIIYFVKQIDNKSIKFSCRSKIPKTAYEFANKELKKIFKDPNADKKFKLLFEDAIEKFLAEKMKAAQTGNIKIDTYKSIENSLKYSKQYFANKYVDVFEDDSWPDTWDAFTSWFKLEYSGQTIFNVVKSVRGLSKFLLERGYISRKPAIVNRYLKKEKASVKRKRHRILSNEEIQRLLITAKNNSEKDFIIVALGY